MNIGAETTTISIYNNDKPKMLTVLPLGSNNITRDLTAELISFAQAEEIQFIRGYKSTSNENDGIDNETVSKVIYARMGEILKNVRYQIEESGERVHHIVFTGGGSKLKNLKELLDEFLPNFSTEIKSEPQLNLISESGVNVYGVITTALYGLLKQGKANCCEEIRTNTQSAVPQNTEIFTQSEMEGTNEQEENELNEKKRIEEEERRKAKEEEKKRRELERKKQKEARKNSWKGIGNIFQEWLTNATSDPDDEETKENNDQ